MSGPTGAIDPTDPRERFILAYADNTHALHKAAAEIEACRAERIRMAQRFDRLEEYERDAEAASAEAKRAEKERIRKAAAETKTWRENIAWLIALPEFRLTVAAIMGGLLLRYVPGVSLPDPPKEAPRVHAIAPAGGSDAP